MNVQIVLLMKLRIDASISARLRTTVIAA